MTTIDSHQIPEAPLKVINAKIVHLIESYVSTLAIRDGLGLMYEMNPEGESLEAEIAELHSKFLTRQDAAEILLRACAEFSAANPGRAGSLADKENSDLKLALTNSISTYLESLPRQYTLRIYLPLFPRWGQQEYTLSRAVRLAIVNPPMDILRSNVSQFDHPSYIEFSAAGYSNWTPDSQATSECLSLAKQFSFILTAYGIGRLIYAEPRATATLRDDRTHVGQSIALPDSVARCFGQMTVDQKKLLTYDRTNAATLLGGTTRPAETTEEMHQALEGALVPVTRFFAAHPEPDFNSIAAAIEWYEDAKFADNQTFSYMAACIGLEALLGSNDYMENMSKRLADRYAFLLGKTRTEREKMIRDYGDVLRLRGKLVHSKVARIDSKDLSLLFKARQMLYDAIWHQVSAMYRVKDGERAFGS